MQRRGCVFGAFCSYVLEFCGWSFKTSRGGVFSRNPLGHTAGASEGALTHRSARGGDMSALLKLAQTVCLTLSKSTNSDFFFFLNPRVIPRTDTLNYTQIHYTDQILSPLLLLPSVLQMNSGISAQRSRHPPQTENHSKACKGGWSGVFEYDRCLPAGLLLSAAVTFRSPFTHFTCSAAAPSVGGKGEIRDPSSGAAEKALPFSVSDPAPFTSAQVTRTCKHLCPQDKKARRMFSCSPECHT